MIDKYDVYFEQYFIEYAVINSNKMHLDGSHLSLLIDGVLNRLK